jgi:hypothetical protein
MNLSREEMETHLNMTGDDHGTWHVYSDDPVLQRKLESIGATLIKRSSDGIGKHYTLRANQVSFRRGNPVSDERKAEMGDRMRALREKQTAIRAVDLTIDSGNGSK